MTSDVTVILKAIETGDTDASSRLLPLVYGELRRLAANKMVHERADHTLQPTALVHEAYLRLVDGNPAPSWQCRAHFFAAAAQAMRRILIDEARRKAAARRGGPRAGAQRVDIELDQLAATFPGHDMLALDEALHALAAEDPMKARLIEFRFFAGMTLQEAAVTLNISPATAKRHWTYARAWLRQRLKD